MLNRANEKNMIRSYFGVYDLYHVNRFSHIHEDNNCYMYYDEKLRLKTILSESKGYKGFRLTTQDSISVLFYGELYNFSELIDKINRDIKDQEYLSFSHLCCLLYQKYGCYFAKYINGIFSLVLRDSKEDVLLLIVDRFGLARPVYYNISSRLTFSSHLKFLLESKEFSSDIDKDALSLFLKYGYIPSPKTILKNIRKLSPGEMLICQGQQYNIKRYIDFEINRVELSYDEALEEYRSLLSCSMSSLLNISNRERLGIFLSGGLDSSANVAIAHKLNKCKFETFGVGFKNTELDERPYAKIVADYFDVPFNDYELDGSELEDLPRLIWHFEEPFLENGLFLTYGGFKSASAKADIVISGDCSDQFFGTGGFAAARPIALRYLIDRLYLHSLFRRLSEATKNSSFNQNDILFKIKILLNRSVSFNDWFFWGYDKYELKQLYNFDIDENVFNVFENNIKNNNTLSDYYNYSLIHQDIEHYACQNILVKTYRLAEMFGIISRNPFLNYNVVDFILSLDIKMKRNGDLLNFLLGNTTSKFIHRKTMESILPKRILTKSKQGGFVSMALMLSDPQRRKKIFSYLLKSHVISSYFKIAYVKKLINEYQYLVKEGQRWQSFIDLKANQLLYLLTFALWYEMFVESRPILHKDRTLSDMIMLS